MTQGKWAILALTEGKLAGREQGIRGGE